MTTEDLVLIDTCQWVPFFNSRSCPEKSAVVSLVKRDRAALIGPILTEVLNGFRHDAQADWAASALKGAQYVDLTWHDWRRASQLFRSLVSRGHQLPISDLALAAASQRYNIAIYTSDPHFDLIPKLKRYRPA